MLLVQVEIILFFLSGLYIVFFVVEKIIGFVKKRVLLHSEKKNRILHRKKQSRERKQKKNIQSEKSQSSQSSAIEYESQSRENAEKIREIIKRVKINISRGYLESAQSILIEWFALEKNNKELNLLLADIYEREKKYQNAEYIYRDILDIMPEDSFVLQRLWNIYTLREKISKAYTCYKKAFDQDSQNREIIDILSHLALETKDYKNALKYTQIFLRQKPRDAEKLSIKWYAQEMLGKHADAIKSYKSVLDIQPYNRDIAERLEGIHTS